MANIRQCMMSIMLVLVMITGQDTLGAYYCESLYYFMVRNISATDAHVGFHAGDGLHVYCYYNATLPNTGAFVINGPNTPLANAPNCAARFNGNPGRLSCCNCCCGVSPADFIPVSNGAEFISVDVAHCERTPGGD